MAHVTEQVHGKFKVFAGPLAADSTIGPLADEVAAWVREAKVAPRSIGVEYVEQAKRMILTVGYRDDEPGYDVALETVKIGTVGKLDSGDVSRLEAAMAAATAKVSRVICHEIYVSDAQDFFMVFLRYQG